MRPGLRGTGYGKRLLQTLAQVCQDNGYRRLEWWVLDWNEPALGFYRSIGAAPMDEWTVQRVTGGGLWANLHLLFWLSLIPFVTGWMSENHFPPIPVAAYGVVLLCAGFAYSILTRTLLRLHAGDSLLARALGADIKGKVSLVIYVAAIALAAVSSWLAAALYVAVAIIWLVPDRRIERVVPVTRAR